MTDPVDPAKDTEKESDQVLEPDLPNAARQVKPWMRFVGLGIELASYTLGCTAIGYLIDQQLGNATLIGTAFGTLVGFSFGMFRFIQRASKANSAN